MYTIEETKLYQKKYKKLKNYDPKILAKAKQISETIKSVGTSQLGTDHQLISNSKIREVHITKELLLLYTNIAGTNNIKYLDIVNHKELINQYTTVSDREYEYLINR